MSVWGSLEALLQVKGTRSKGLQVEDIRDLSEAISKSKAGGVSENDDTVRIRVTRSL